MQSRTLTPLPCMICHLLQIQPTSPLQSQDYLKPCLLLVVLLEQLMLYTGNVLELVSLRINGCPQLLQIQ